MKLTMYVLMSVDRSINCRRSFGAAGVACTGVGCSMVPKTDSVAMIERLAMLTLNHLSRKLKTFEVVFSRIWEYPWTPRMVRVARSGSEMLQRCRQQDVRYNAFKTIRMEPFFQSLLLQGLSGRPRR